MNLIDKDKTMEEIPIDVCDGFEVTDIIEKIPIVQAILLDKVKKARKEIDNLPRYFDNDLYSDNEDSMFKCNEVLEILDRMIESEEK